MLGDRQQTQPSSSSVIHFCRVCNRGFGCGGALGGHMRSHGLGDHATNKYSSDEDQEGQTISFNDNNNNNNKQGQKHSYFLRRNTNRHLKFHAVEECNQDYGVLSPMSSYGSDIGGDPNTARGQRSENHMEYCPSSEEEEDDDEIDQEEDLAKCLVMLSNKSFILSHDPIKEVHKAKEVENKGMFQCKACKKVFNSHQALGGHRASHKKVKGCYAAKYEVSDHRTSTKVDDDVYVEEDSITRDDLLDANNQLRNIASESNKKKTKKLHECSICRRVFSSGQALGGHKRCHWLTSNLQDTTLIPNFNGFQCDANSNQQLFKKPMLSKVAAEPLLDLNFPAFHDSGAAHNQASVDQLGNPLFTSEASRRICLQLWGRNNEEILGVQNQQAFSSNTISMHGSMQEDLKRSSEGAECRNKLAQMSDLEDMNNLEGGRSRWLQVGIASTDDGCGR